MRVDFTTSGLEPPEKGTTGRAGHTGHTDPTGTGSGTGTSSISGLDQTRFSFDQTRVQSLEAHVLAQPEVREAKVQSLRQAIGNGEYSVPASQVADALISELSGAHG
jgi:flagellar biosynthesis anti-sigma factor FlgM